MKAAWYTRTGAASEVLHYGDLDEPPAPKAGEVLVKLHASGVNPSDWKVRKGGYGRPLARPLIIPHSDGAGVIEAIGPGANSRVGERVWIWNGQWLRPFGTAAPKASHALNAGSDEVINYRSENVASRVQEITNGCNA